MTKQMKHIDSATEAWLHFQILQRKLYTEEERENLWIQKQEEGYKFIMGEKHKVENPKDEEEWEKLSNTTGDTA